MKEIEEYMIKKKIYCTKYNYSLERSVQNFQQYEAYIKYD